MSQFTGFLLNKIPLWGWGTLVQGILHGTLQVNSMMVNPDPSIRI